MFYATEFVVTSSHTKELFKLSEKMKALPIQELIERRCDELSISHRELVIRTGVDNIAKGHRRLLQLLDGDFVSSRGFLEKLPAALEIDPALLEDAVNLSKQQISEEIEVDWRANFKPHAVAITANNGRPRQITIAAICNAGRHVYIDFPVNLARHDFKDYALNVIQKRAKEIANFFYSLEGFVINYTPDLAIKYDLQGVEIGQINKEVKVGKLSFTLR